MFSWALDKFIREPVNKQNDLWTLYQKLSQQLKSECCINIDCKDEQRQQFQKIIDAEIILLNKVGVEKVAYVREQYWYYMEFCLNLFASLLGMLLVTIYVLFCKIGFDASANMGGLLIAIVALTAISILVFKAAQKNHELHLGKMNSLMVANLMDASEHDINNKPAVLSE